LISAFPVKYNFKFWGYFNERLEGIGFKNNLVGFGWDRNADRLTDGL
jgi:hypothetical protein